MPLTVKAVQRVGKAIKAIAKEYDNSLAYIHVVFPEQGEVHRFQASNGNISHIESHSPKDTVWLTNQEIDGDICPY